MPSEPLWECSFFVPLKRDANLSDGSLHDVDAWNWIQDQLVARFTGRTVAPGLYSGAYTDPDTGQPVADESRRYIVAVETEKIDDVRQLLREACDWFHQKCIYLSVAGRVEFVGRDVDAAERDPHDAQR